ncbi:MAG: diguanylate cyclase [Desulfarculaceae bacterium]|nr:diguanylate cyclase [Desulfarculaceae bacterium]MCF8073794.1 diguanylate cyclase [Desulfarculaceae bacterium]MCF8102035.1 diguanylate cyclase [Desulfarculaceae bacterium]MCF8116005.1 diguanylate cyclase [Desulfarculaceae bacterium]
MKRDSYKPLSGTSPLVYFLKLYIPMFIVVVGVAVTAAMLLQERHVREIQQSQKLHVLLEREVLEAEILAHVSDAVYLADLTALALANPAAKVSTEKILQGAYYFFSRSQGIYDQVRFLSPEGQELVRVNRNSRKPVLVPASKLQNKAERYYFTEGMKLKPGEVYISPFDLNVEHGKVERPLKPTLRFSSPVQDPRGGRAGLVVLNLLGARVLDRLRRMGQSTGSQNYLINREGWWLASPTPEMEWGFQLAERSGANMGVVFPQAWQDIASHTGGQFFTPNGLFTFQMVRVLNQAGELGSDLPHGKLDDLWWVVSRVPPETLVLPWRLPQIGLVLALLALLALLAWFVAVARSRRARAEKQMQDEQKRLEAVSNASQEAIAIVDSQDRVQFWNRAAESLFGYTRQEAMGRSLHEMVTSPEVRPKAMEGMALFAQAGQGPVLEGLRQLMAQRKDGSSFPAEIAVSAFRMDGHWFAGGNVRDISDRKQYERELKRLANTDGLTGVSNRRRFLELAEQEIVRAGRYGRPLSLLMLDLDHFKAVNDTHGHEVGDQVLKSFVQVCLSVLRQVDIFGRVGGEEFMAMLPETDQEGALGGAERLRAAVAGAAVKAGGVEVKYTVSIGAAVWREGMGLEELMNLSDQALYQAKEAGRDQVALAQEGTPPPGSGENS